MDISTFDKEVKLALEALPEEPIKYVKAVVSSTQNFEDNYFVDITWYDGVTETVSQLKVERDITPEDIHAKVKAAYEFATLQYML